MAGRRWVCLAVVLVAGVGACNSAASAGLRLHPCLVHCVKARCGALSVPENRAVAGGRTIRLRVVVRRGPGSPHRAAPLFYLEAGREGRPATLSAGSRRLSTGSATWCSSNQRGTGGSRPLLCPALREAPPAEAVGRLLACVARLGADPAQFGTVAAMRDVEAVRSTCAFTQLVTQGGGVIVLMQRVPSLPGARVSRKRSTIRVVQGKSETTWPYRPRPQRRARQRPPA